MKKMVKVAIVSIYLITASAIAFGSTINDKKNDTFPAESDELIRFIWYNGDREEQVFASKDEVAIFAKNVSEKANTILLAQNFDPHATLIEDYDFVTLWHFPEQLDKNALENKIVEFYNKTGNKASFVFYRGSKKDQARMVLTGEIIVKFKPDWNETKIAAWAKEMGLEMVKSFSFSNNTYLFNAGPSPGSLEIADQIYLSGQVVFAYPNWWKAMELKKDQSRSNNTNISDENKTSSVKIPFISNNVVITIIILSIYLKRRK